MLIWRWGAALFYSLLNEEPVKFEDRGMGAFYPKQLEPPIPYAGWAHFSPKRTDDGILYFWNEEWVDGDAQAFLKLGNKQSLLQAIRTRCNKGLVCLIESEDSPELTLFARLGNRTARLNVAHGDSLAYILKVQKRHNGLIIHSVKNAEYFIDEGFQAKDILIDRWFLNVATGSLTHINQQAMRKACNYPDFHFRWSPMRFEYFYSFHGEIKHDGFLYSVRGTLRCIYDNMDVYDVILECDELHDFIHLKVAAYYNGMGDEEKILMAISDYLQINNL